MHLQQAGHPHYVEWSKSYECKKITESELQDLNEQMKRDLQAWLNKVSSLRTQLHALNYFTSLQLLRISNEFYCLINNPNHEISNEIFLLLMSLSPNLTVRDIKKVTSTAEAQAIALRSLPSLTPPDHDESYQVMNEIDVPGEIDKLNEEQKEVYFSSVQDYGFNPQLVLAAIRQYGSNEDDVLEWCFDPKNAEVFDRRPVASEDSLKATKSEVDTSNATVQDLIDLEFPELLSIEAVKECGEELEKCIQYCSDKTLASSANFSDETDDISENILLDGDVSYGTETRDASLSVYVTTYVHTHTHIRIM